MVIKQQIEAKIKEVVNKMKKIGARVGFPVKTYDKGRPLNGDAVYFIRLWYLGQYRGAHALRRLSIRQIARVLHRNEARVREALQPYLTKEDEAAKK